LNSNDVYEEKLNAQLWEWGAKIDELIVKAEKAKTEAKLEYSEQIEALRAKQ